MIIWDCDCMLMVVTEPHTALLAYVSFSRDHVQAAVHTVRVCM